MTFSMEHKGVCYRNSNLNPASAEEMQAIIAARDLLLDENGKYVGDDKAILAMIVNSDNDTRSQKSFMVEQNTIVGGAADTDVDTAAAAVRQYPYCPAAPSERSSTGLDD